MMVNSKLILVAGDGRNVGKTTLLSKIIELLSKKHTVSAIKVSGHIHQTTKKQKLVHQEDGLLIFEETDRRSGKDSARYLASGATKAFFVQTDDESLPNLVKWMENYLDGMIVCESRSIGNHLIPDKAIFVQSDHPSKSVDWKFSYQITSFKDEQFEPGVSMLLQGIL